MNRELLKNIYLEWRNDFLTVERFSEYHGLTTEQGEFMYWKEDKNEYHY